MDGVSCTLILTLNYLTVKYSLLFANKMNSS